MTSDAFLPGYRVLDLTDEKGVFCTKLLADYGADVIRIEPPSGDAGRLKGPFPNDEPGANNSLYYAFFNTNKRSITLSIETEAGRDLLRKLVAKADVLVECHAVGYLDRLGLGYKELRDLNPELVMASITPFGQTGPWREYKSADLVVTAASGYMQITGEPDEAPVRLGNDHSHYPAAQCAAVAIVAALYHRDAISGMGQHIDVSQQEALLTYHTDAHPALLWRQRGENVIRVGTNSDLVIPLGAYPCSDGWVAAGVITGREWDTLAQWIHEVTGNEEILNPAYRGGTQERYPHKDIVSALFMDFTARFTVQELFHEGQRRNLVFLPVNEVGDLLSDPQLEASRFWRELDHPTLGSLRYPLGIFDGDDIPVSSMPAPELGQHNQDIYCDEMGVSLEELVMLRGAGVI